MLRAPMSTANPVLPSPAVSPPTTVIGGEVAKDSIALRLEAVGMTEAAVVSDTATATLPTAGKDSSAVDSTASTLPPMLLTLQEDVTIIGLDGLHWLLAPLSWSGGEWLTAGGVLAATGGAMLIDEDVRDLARRNRSSGGDDLASLANEAGRLQWAQVLTGALYVPGLLLGVDELRVTGRMLAQSLLYSGAVTMAVRIAFGRNRPWSGEPSDSYEGWQFSNDVQSLPSGHTTVAFAMASVLAPRIAHPAASVLLYLAAASTGVARIYEDHHWLSDVLLGAAIGQAAGMYVTNREERRTSGADASASWMLVPSPRGVTFSYTF
jgi:membrane-associated phospholipid phosphatase